MDCITFVPAFVSQECRDWEREMAAEMERRGLDINDRASRAAVRAKLGQVSPAPRASLRQVADHIQHVREVAGIEHVGIGGDFDGTDDLPDGLGDVSCYPALFAELLGRGWSEEDCGKLAGGNLLRVMWEAEAASRAISARRGPSMATMEGAGGQAWGGGAGGDAGEPAGVS